VPWARPETRREEEWTAIMSGTGAIIIASMYMASTGVFSLASE